MNSLKGCDRAIWGQTAINLAAGLEANGVNVLGTAVADLDRAEDRELFDQVIKQLGLKSNLWARLRCQRKEVLACAHEIGYPVLVRPSYVLGGRAMEIVNNDEELTQYLAENAHLAKRTSDLGRCLP